MALKTNELFSTASGLDETRTIAEKIAPKVFALGSGTILRNAPVAYNTSLNKWAPWISGGPNGTGTVKGFLFPDPVTLDAADESIGNVMTRGIIHSDDVKAATSEADADVDTMLRTDARLIGIDVQGIDQVR